MSTNLPGFQLFFRFLHLFRVEQISQQSSKGLRNNFVKKPDLPINPGINVGDNYLSLLCFLVVLDILGVLLFRVDLQFLKINVQGEICVMKRGGVRMFGLYNMLK